MTYQDQRRVTQKNKKLANGEISVVGKLQHFWYRKKNDDRITQRKALGSFNITNQKTPSKIE